jgi:predicted TIM-barrel fold metal-dependent hydrolase
VAVIGNPNPVRGRHIHDPEFEPLWDAIEELFPHAIEEFIALEGVSDKTKAKILWDNCARLYKLNGVR